MRRALAVAVAVLLAFAVPAQAQAQSIVGRAAHALRTNEVYVDPQAEVQLSPADQQRIRRRISKDQAGPMYVAVLPDAAKDQAGGSVRGVAMALIHRLHRQGTYAIIAGHSFAGTSTTIDGAADAATASLDARKSQGPEAILLDYVDRIGQLSSDGTGAGSGGEGGTGGAVATIVILVLLAGGGIALIASRRRRRRRAAEAMDELRDNARDDLVALGEDIGALDLDVDMPGADPQARAAYARAVDAYERADTVWHRARDPEDLAPFSAALEEGRWAMSAAKARLEGRPVPERRPPCFFDPRHGPSSRDVEWAPPGGAPRMVPACEADAQRVERGDDPESREVLVGGQWMPYWNAGPMYAPWAGGFFGGYGGGLLPGLVMGTLLGEALAPPVVYGGDWDGGNGGDFGGGDFGGGDFGGGDFGGGDFGGGDF